MRRTSALIVGGGPAGAAAAIGLARAGAMPLLIERSAGERDVVCGGFLGWDAVARLRQLGLDPAKLGARTIQRLRLVAGRQVIERPLPEPAMGLSRRRLDSALLAVAEGQGAEVLRGRAARSAEDRVVRLDDGEEIAADALFLATGKHELRGLAREVGGRKVAVGLRAALPASAGMASDLAGVIELHLYDGGYAGLLLQEDGRANLCLSVAQRRMGQGRDALLAALWEEAPLLADRVGLPPAEWEAIAGVPYGWRAKATTPEVYRVGDQAAVIASLAGDGIAIALASGAIAAQACLQGEGALGFQRAFARRAFRPVIAAEALRHMAEHRRERRVMMGLSGLAGLAARMTRIG